MRKLVPTCLAAAAIAAALPTIAAAADFKLHSPTIAAKSKIGDAHVFNGFGCSGQNASPELQWGTPPKGTQSLAVTVYDPDAPTGSGWWHWVVLNIPADQTGLPAGFGNQEQTPFGLQTTTDFGKPGWGGPCPPMGAPKHRYIFTVYALKVPRIEVPVSASGAMAGFNIKANAIGQSSFTAYYGR